MLRATVAVICVATGIHQTAQANDIVDFFRALSGPSRHVESGHRHAYRPVGSPRGLDFHDRYEHADHGHHRTNFGRYGYSDPRFSRSFHSTYPRTASRSSFSLRFDSGRPVGSVGYPVAPVVPVAPVPGSFAHLPHQLGQFVTCPVPLETCVDVRNPHEIAPGAIPRVIAVRDPHLGRFRTCVEQLAYVQVFVPPCEPRRVRISPCQTRIRLDYGRYDVTIESRNDVIEVTYHN